MTKRFEVRKTVEFTGPTYLVVDTRTNLPVDEAQKTRKAAVEYAALYELRPELVDGDVCSCGHCRDAGTCLGCDSGVCP